MLENILKYFEIFALQEDIKISVVSIVIKLEVLLMSHSVLSAFVVEASA